MVKGTDDPVTDRKALERHYADNEKLAARASIFAYAEQPVDPLWRLRYVEWTGRETVLDVGCGPASDLRQLVEKGMCRRGLAVDLSRGMLASVNKWVDSDGAPVVGIQADAMELPIRSGSVDVAFAFHMLYHVPEIPRAVKECRRVLRDGGRLVVTVGAGGPWESMVLLEDVAADLAGCPLSLMPELPFTDKNGSTYLEPEFSKVERHILRGRLAVPHAEPVLAAVESLRDPIEATVGDALDWQALMGAYKTRVEEVIRGAGAFHITIATAVFVCT